MPKSKIFWFEDALKFLAEEIKSWARHRNRSASEMANATWLGVGTWYSRLRNPKNITVEEAWKAINYLKIPTEDAVKMMTAGIESLKK